MKYRHTLLIIFLVIVIDQITKIYVKTHFHYHDSVNVFGSSWFQIFFIENPGMAFGMTINDAPLGKLLLTLFRLVAVIFGFFLLKRLVVKQYHKGLLICGALILAGALGNLIDSIFYGMIFSKSLTHGQNVAEFVPWGQGYAGLFHGKVVDMLYFPIIDTTWPEWVPFKGGDRLSFFDPVFNIADTAISCGVIVLLLFQKTFMKAKPSGKSTTEALAAE